MLLGGSGAVAWGWPGASRTEPSSASLLATLNAFGDCGSVSSYRVGPHPEGTRKEACPWGWAHPPGHSGGGFYLA